MIKPKRIIHNGNATIVFWNDNTKTVVRCAEDDTQDNYNAFCAAYCKKVFGNNSHLKRVIKDAENARPEKRDKPKDCLSPSVRRFNEHLKEAFWEEAFSPIVKTVMPGCRGCCCADTCPDRYSVSAIHCNLYI